MVINLMVLILVDLNMYKNYFHMNATQYTIHGILDLSNVESWVR